MFAALVMTLGDVLRRTTTKEAAFVGGTLEGGVTGARPILSGLTTCDFAVHGGAFGLPMMILF